MRYSPYAITDYGLQHGGGVVLPYKVDLLAVPERLDAWWNLIWASTPEVDGFLDLKYEDFDGFRELVNTFPFKNRVWAANLLEAYPALATCLATGTPAESALTLSANPFLLHGVLQDNTRKWVATTMARLDMAQSLVDVNEAKAVCQSVVAVDFKARRRM